MIIAIIGTGSVGSALATGWRAAGHALILGSRDPEAPATNDLAASAGARLASPREAAEDADVVMLALPYEVVVETVRGLGDLTSKVLVDCTNPVGPNLTHPMSPGESAAQEIASVAPGAHVIKAFCTLGAALMDGSATAVAPPLALFLRGNSVDAKRTVSDLAGALGLAPVDCGGLDRARLLEDHALLWSTLAGPGGLGPRFGFAIVRA